MMLLSLVSLKKQMGKAENTKIYRKNKKKKVKIIKTSPQVPTRSLRQSPKYLAAIKTEAKLSTKSLKTNKNLIEKTSKKKKRR